MPHGELSTLWTHNFGKISFPKKEDNKEIYSLILGYIFPYHLPFLETKFCQNCVSRVLITLREALASYPYCNCIYLCNDDDQSGQTIPSKICQIKILKHHTDNQLVFYAYLQNLHELAVLAHLIISFCSENF